MEPAQEMDKSQSRKAAIGGLAVVGFIALILIGIATAIYAASFIPNAFSKLSSANVYLSSALQPSDNGNGGLVATNPTATSTGTVVTSVPLSPAEPTSTAPVIPAQTTKPVAKPAPTYTPPATYTQPVIVPATPSYYGSPDLVTTITSVGYLTRMGDTSSFVTADTVPYGYQGAVRFVVANHGTNVAGSWYFEGTLPASGGSSYYRSSYQRSLNPGDSIVFTLGFDAAGAGSKSIRITAAPNNTLAESNQNNNSDSASIYLAGTGYSNGIYDSNGNYCSNGTYYSNGRYYCSSSTSNSGNYDSNGAYCPNGTYYTGGRYYCNTNTSGNSSHYDSNGNYCTYGTTYSNGRYYCTDAYGNSTGTNSSSYDSNGNYCAYGTYYSNGRYYCNVNYGSNNGTYDSNGNYCRFGTYYSNGRTYCQ